MPGLVAHRCRGGRPGLLRLNPGRRLRLAAHVVIMRTAIVDLTGSASLAVPDLSGYDSWLVVLDQDQLHLAPAGAHETVTWQRSFAPGYEFVAIRRAPGREPLYEAGPALRTTARTDAAAAAPDGLRPDIWLLWLLHRSGFHPHVDDLVDLTDTAHRSIPMHAVQGLFPLEGLAA